MQKNNFEATHTHTVISPLTPEYKEHLELKKITDDLTPPGFRVLGSWAVHIYHSPITTQIEYKIQTNFPEIIGHGGEYEGMTEAIASQSLDAALFKLKSMFRKKKK